MSPEPKFKEGEIVFDRVRPNQMLVINKIVGRIYHCHALENPMRYSLVFFEKELKGNSSPLNKSE